MGAEPPVPDTRVLAIASHVVSGNVGNKIAVFAMQSLGCDVAALNTVQFSNHTGYRQWRGSRVSAEEISDLYAGLQQSYLDDFDMMLSGYIPGAAAVEAVGRIALSLRRKAEEADRPGGFFWVLDPVMGDHGNLYVAEDVVPAYKRLVGSADLILPNQFEAELLSDVKIKDMASLEEAIGVMHARYGVPHIVITSVAIPHPDHPPHSLSVVGSSMTRRDKKARPFKIVFPAIDAYFSGTGDMFSALMAVRMREAALAAPAPGGGLGGRRSWLSGDEVGATELPLARAAEKVLGSMNEVLEATCRGMKEAVERAEGEFVGLDEEEVKRRLHLLKSRAAELRLVRNLDSLRSPTVKFKAVKM